MMTGIVTANREAILTLQVQDVNGVMREIETVVNTGYNGFVTLPTDFVAALGLVAYGQRVVTLGDGQDVLLQVYEAAVVWGDAPHTGTCHRRRCGSWNVPTLRLPRYLGCG